MRQITPSTGYGVLNVAFAELVLGPGGGGVLKTELSDTLFESDWLVLGPGVLEKLSDSLNRCMRKK